MNYHKENSITIYEACMNIKDRKYVMPAFQRQYVWNMTQIEKLWDSILLGYPISTFLFWHVDEKNVSGDTFFCDFPSEAIWFNSKKQLKTPNYATNPIDFSMTNTAILDGQQRLTSLLISLFLDVWMSKSEYSAKLVIELDKNMAQLSDESFNTKKYDIRWTDKSGRLSPSQFEIREIINNQEFQDEDKRIDLIDNVIKKVPQESKDYAKKILFILCKKIYDEKLIRYTEIFDMNQDDALEMFVRFNSGGKALKKSEITMSILEVYWSKAKDYFNYILPVIGDGIFKDFGEEFIIRTSLMLYGEVAKSNINKKTADGLKNYQGEFSMALNNLAELFKEMNINLKRFASRWNVLLPIIYVIYYNEGYKNCIDGIKAYLIRATLFSYFKSGTTGKLNQLRNNINNFDCELSVELLQDMKELRVTDARIEDILMAEKGSKIADDALYYLALEWYEEEISYDQDHIHPESGFDSYIRGIQHTKMREYEKMCNRLPNLELLDTTRNKQKSDTPLIDWYNSLTPNAKEEFKKQGMIPEVSLELKDFEIFYEERKKYLASKLKSLLG
ncbi:DUF262 domain-containing protein [Treponema putidum]|uniref:DUF262 domain-containing protein n=1 Tax=Treponema putidum TaxID=221027 RepID=A0ABY5HSE3_9SPIR|nr:DUF262 domain-containing protein [Treponema putidum]UTY27723.1 DUF262 domain-containing protein [Treponema putidum]